MRWVFLLLLAVTLLLARREDLSTGTVSGGIVQTEPWQRPVVKPALWQVGAHRLEPLADFMVEGRVLGATSFQRGREARLSPLDLALGWGPMSDPAVLDTLTIEHGARWFKWSARPPLRVPAAEIFRHSANIHIIPADEALARRLQDVRVGDIVALEGQLVAATGDDGWRWRSSLSRTDRGWGACELLRVTRLSVRAQV